MQNHLIIIAISIVGLISCNNSKPSTPVEIEVKSEFTAKINQSAGEFLSDSIFDPLPMFFNIGTIYSEEKVESKTIVLSEKLSKGGKINIKPVGILSFDSGTKKNKYVISVPADVKKNTFEVFNYHQFSQEKFQTKYLIEDWFRSSCKLGKCKSFVWGNEIQAIKLIERN